jgi:hypothetical protein
LSTTTQTSIVNRALQLLGYKSISSINDNDRGANSMRIAYQPVLEALLRENFWSFSIKRIILAASATHPIFGKANYFSLPGDFLMLAPPDQYTNYAFGVMPAGLIPSTPNTGMNYNDFQIESFPGGGKAIASDAPSPLYIRYVSNNIVEADYDSSFTEAFAAILAMETCEALTQSNAKMQTAMKAYDDAINLAKKRNAFEEMPVQSPVDPWILARW